LSIDDCSRNSKFENRNSLEDYQPSAVSSQLSAVDVWRRCLPIVNRQSAIVN